MPLRTGLTATSLRFVAGVATAPLPTAEPPILVADSATLINLDSVVVRPLLNDQAPNGQGLSIIGIGGPAHGQASLDGDAVTYRPVAGYVGADQLTYTVLASGGGLASSVITFDVQAPPPLIASDAGDMLVDDQGLFLALESA